jgi:hypothetical protein
MLTYAALGGHLGLPDHVAARGAGSCRGLLPDGPPLRGREGVKSAAAPATSGSSPRSASSEPGRAFSTSFGSMM